MLTVQTTARTTQHRVISAALAAAVLVSALPAINALTPIVTPSKPSTAQAAPQAPDMSKVDLGFEPNKGQVDSSINYVVRASGSTLLFGRDEVTMRMRTASVTMEFLGANPSATMAGGAVLPGKVNYMRGSNASQWRTNIPTYGDVTYDELYRGISLNYDGTGGRLKGTYTVAPGADPSQIAWNYSGAEKVTLGAQGNLQIKAGAETVEESAPVAWQETDGKRVPVTAAFALGGDGTVGFKLGAYDTTRPLTIDPTITFGTLIGGQGTDTGYGVGLDGSGNIYISGEAWGDGYPLVNPYRQWQGATDLFITKFTPDGSTILWSTYIGGLYSERAEDMDVDAMGYVYMTGKVENSDDFPTTATGFDLHRDSTDAYLMKFSPNGNQILYSTFWGGLGVENGLGVKADELGRAVITGWTDSDDMFTRNAVQANYGGGRDLFVAKFDTNAAGDASLLWSTYLGGPQIEAWGRFHAMGMDYAGNVVITSDTMSASYPTTPGAFDTTFAGGGNPDVVVTKLNPNGGFVYSTFLGAGGSDAGKTAALDTYGFAYVAGTTGSRDNFPTTPGAFSTVCGDQDMFMTKLSQDGSSLVWSTCIDGGIPFDIEINNLGEVYMTGNTRSDTFPLANPIQHIYRSFEDTFVLRLNPQGSRLLFSTYLTGSQGQGGANALSNGYSLALDAQRNVYVAGVTSSSDFPTANGHFSYAGGGSDAYLLKIHDPSVACSTEYSDVPPGSAFYPYVRCLACKGVLGGYLDGTFRPNLNVTRGQLSKIVANAAGYNEPVSGQSFSDVPPSNPFYEYIERMASRGIIGGYQDGTFRPGNNATRGQISKIVSNAAGFTDVVTGQAFQDVAPGSTYYDFIGRLASRNIMSGYPCGGPGEPCGIGSKPYFRPNNNATRGQVAKIVANGFYPFCVVGEGPNGEGTEPVEEPAAQPTKVTR